MLSLFLAAAFSANPGNGCKLELDREETVVERRILKLPHGAIEAISASRPDNNHLGAASRLMVLSSNCTVIFSRRFEDATKLLFSEERLGQQRIIFVTAFMPGGSGAGFDHLLIAYGPPSYLDDALESLAPTSLRNSNMDGLFVGDLGRGRGPGLVMWSAQWEDEAHYEPHRYKVVSYRWRDGRFTGPSVRTTKNKYSPDDPDEVARRLGLGLHDMTKQERFDWR